MTQLNFPKNFQWGVATSAYQIEGAWNKDGRGVSIWDTFARTPGKTLNGETGDVACDHYHRWPEDIALMKELGVQTYRFSVSWPRILPDGGMQINQAGLDHYQRLVDGLLEAGITPFPTLYHWELPQPLQDKGGWPNRETAQSFAHLAHVTSEALGDKIDSWITHNEPWCASMLSHQLGIHAPGMQDWTAALEAAHTILLSHGLATQAIRANAPHADVGIAPNFEPAYPASTNPEDLAAARIWDGYYIRWFLDPLVGRGYPADMVEHYMQQGYLPNGLDFVQDGDLETIAAPTDFWGVNLYTRHLARAGESLDEFPFPDHVPADELTAMNWEVYPDALRDVLIRVGAEYNIPKIYVTENGCSYPDGPDENGRIEDVRRINYLQKHLTAVHQAIEAGAPVKGYLQWSFMDNYEWALGYSQRFGMVHVDYDTLERRPKDSAYWYRDVIRANAIEEGE